MYLMQENKYQINDIKPYMVNKYNGGGSGYVYYTGYKNGEKVFIKGVNHVPVDALEPYNVSRMLRVLENAKEHIEGNINIKCFFFIFY